MKTCSVGLSLVFEVVGKFSSNEYVMFLSMKYPNSQAAFIDLALINYSPEPAINTETTTTPLLQKCPINRA